MGQKENEREPGATRRQGRHAQSGHVLSLNSESPSAVESSELCDIHADTSHDSEEQTRLVTGHD